MGEEDSIVSFSFFFASKEVDGEAAKKSRLKIDLEIYGYLRYSYLLKTNS